MKRCETCILRQLDKDEFTCEGDKQAPECIGILQGTIEMLKTGTSFYISEDEDNASVRIDYTINGEGSVYLPSMPTDEDIALAIINDCDEKEIGVEFI